MKNFLFWTFFISFCFITSPAFSNVKGSDVTPPSDISCEELFSFLIQSKPNFEIVDSGPLNSKEHKRERRNVTQRDKKLQPENVRLGEEVERLRSSPKDRGSTMKDYRFAMEDLGSAMADLRSAMEDLHSAIEEYYLSFKDNSADDDKGPHN